MLRTLFLTGLAAFCFGQSADPKLSFEVASVKPGGAGRALFLMRGGPGTADPGQIDFSGVPMRFILVRAYKIERYQLSGPAWLDTERYDINAKIPMGTTEEQFRIMLQNLLIERFNMVVHHETRDLPGYEMSVAKNGPKFKQPADPASPPPAPEPGAAPRIRTQKNRDGRMEPAPGSVGMIVTGIPGGGTRFSARTQPLSALTLTLESPLGEPVVDKTGLTGKYDFNLTFTSDERTSANVVGGTPPRISDAPDAPPDLFTAMQEQLGLKLEQKKIPMDVVVIDRIEKTPLSN